MDYSVTCRILCTCMQWISWEIVWIGKWMQTVKSDFNQSLVSVSFKFDLQPGPQGWSANDLLCIIGKEQSLSKSRPNLRLGESANDLLCIIGKEQLLANIANNCCGPDLQSFDCLGEKSVIYSVFVLISFLIITRLNASYLMMFLDTFVITIVWLTPT